LKNALTIHMGASRWDVSVNDGHGNPVVFDLYHMTRDQRSQFHREFMKAVRKHIAAPSSAMGKS
jgi:hypothetical protein